MLTNENITFDNNIFSVNPVTSEDKSANDNHIHIRIQQRSGRKSITTISGLDEKTDFKTILKKMKNKFSCNGCIINNDTKFGTILQFQGDQRDNIKDFILENKILGEIVIHGF